MLSPREWAKWAVLCDPNEWQIPPTLAELIDRVEEAIILYDRQQLSEDPKRFHGQINLMEDEEG